MGDASTTVAELRDDVRTFVQAREWERFHAPKELAIAISIEAAELVERFLWRDAVPASSLSKNDRAGIAEELADVVIYSMSLANALDLDLSDAIRAKLSKNEAKYPARRFRGVAPG